MGAHTKDKNSFESLRQHRWESCEICDKRFHNKYTLLQHNLSHIIIPLINQTTHECPECYYHFFSIEDLTEHTENQHNQPTEITNIKNEVEEELSEKLPEILQSIVDKQVYVKCENELQEVFEKENEQLQNRSGFLQFEEDVEIEDVKSECDFETDDVITLNDDGHDEESWSNDIPDEKPMHRRLLFEEDIDDTLFKDLTTQCQVKLESIYPNMCLDVPPDEVIIEQPEDCNSPLKLANISLIHGGESNTQKPTTDLIQYAKAVHHDVLMENEDCMCRLCKRHFPNRFYLLKHELKHLHIKQKQWRSPLCCICERYIAGNYHNLRRHIEAKHPENKHYDSTTDKCNNCNHQYHNYSKHLKYYHEYYKCHKCQNGFDSPKLLDKHICAKTTDSISSQLAVENSDEPLKKAVSQLCEVCFSFLNIYTLNRQNYMLIGETNGVRQVCDKCNSKVLDVKFVMRKLKNSNIGTDASKKKYTQTYNNVCKLKKPISNEERLKKLHKKLKMMKQINKF